MSDPYVPSLTHPVPALKSKVIADTATYTGEWARAQVIDEATINSITCPLKENAAGLTGVALADGVELKGPITSIKLTSGVVELFER